MICGEVKACFGVTEPDTGLNTTSRTTRAERRSNDYVICGRKIWTSIAQGANKMLIIARTTPKDQVRKATEGLSLFYTDFDRSTISKRASHRQDGTQGGRVEPASSSTDWRYRPKT